MPVMTGIPGTVSRDSGTARLLSIAPSGDRSPIGHLSKPIGNKAGPEIAAVTGLGLGMSLHEARVLQGLGPRPAIGEEGV